MYTPVFSPGRPCYCRPPSAPLSPFISESVDFMQWKMAVITLCYGDFPYPFYRVQADLCIAPFSTIPEKMVTRRYLYPMFVYLCIDFPPIC